MATTGCTWDGADASPKRGGQADRTDRHDHYADHYRAAAAQRHEEEAWRSGRPVGAAPVESAPLPSDLPHMQKAAEAAARVRTLANDKVKQSWPNLLEEVRVQKLVWESLVLTRKELKDEIAATDYRLDRVVDAYHAGDIDGATQQLQDLGAKQGVLSSSMLKTCKNIPAQAALLPKRVELAEWLEYAPDPAFNDEVKAYRAEIEELVTTCALGDKKLEKRVRQALHLPIPVELQASPVTAAKKPSGTPSGVGAGRINSNGMAPLHWTGSRGLYDITGFGRKNSGAGIPPPSASKSGMGSVYTAGSRTMSQISKGVGAMATASKKLSGTGTGARHTLSNRSQSLGAIARATESMRSTTSAADVPPAASVIRKMAAEKPPASWAKLTEELDVQAMVWQSVALTKPTPVERNVFETQTRAAAQRLRDVLELKSRHPEAALAALEQLLASWPKDSNGKDILNAATRTGCQDVIAHHEAAQSRMDLAERLAVANIPATLPRGDEQKKEAEDVVVKADLRDPELELAARHMLLLPIPPHLEALEAEEAAMPPTRGKPLGSAKFSTVSSMLSTVSSSRRSSSAAGVARRKDSKTSFGRAAPRSSGDRRPSVTSAPRPAPIDESRPLAGGSAKDSRPLAPPAAAGQAAEPEIEEEVDFYAPAAPQRIIQDLDSGAPQFQPPQRILKERL